VDHKNGIQFVNRDAIVITGAMAAGELTVAR
jgi:hypothetical protein